MMKKNRILFKVIIALLLVLLITATSFQVVKEMTKYKMEEYTNKHTEQKAGYANLLANLLFQSNEWTILSFLSSFTDLHTYIDTLTHEQNYLPILRDKDKKTLTPDDIYCQLTSFISYNYEFCSATIIIEPSVLSSSPQGIEIKFKLNDTTPYSMLSKGPRSSENKFYQRLKNSNNVLQQTNREENDSTFVCSEGIALRDESHKVIGAFWIDIDTKLYSKMLSTYKSEDEIVKYIIDKDNKIIASYDSKDNGKWLKDVLPTINGTNLPENWYINVQTYTKINSYIHFRNKIANEYFITYLLPIAGSSDKLLTIKSEKLLYDEVMHFMRTPSIIMIISLLLVIFCLVYLFYTFKKKKDENDYMKNELSVAACIQQDMLPKNILKSKRMDIYGLQRSAKIVGGDLYDFVIKDDLLHFCIGDVSGKGMPAALVMTELCSLYRYIICQYTNPSNIVTQMNNALMEHSDDTMFCTLFVGVLNLKTGMLKFCNAGHNPPILITDATTHFMNIRPNIFLNAFKEYSYQSETIQMNVGDRLFLYTDGVTETKNKENQFFGEKATLQTIDKLKNLPFEQLVHCMMTTLQTFTRKSEQHDDISMLCIEYKGKGKQTELHYDKVKGKVSEIVDAVLTACQLTNDMRLRLGIEEALQNIADYAYPIDGSIDIEINDEEEYIETTLIDNGKPFNPLKVKEPNFSVPITERTLGGLGIFFTRKIMQEISYKYENQHNILKLKYKKNEFAH